MPDKKVVRSSDPNTLPGRVSLDDLETVGLRAVEILAVGTWHGEKGGVQKYTRADLEELAAAHADVIALGAYAPLYLGHNNDPAAPEAPAVGYIDRLYVRGSKLLADITDVPALVAKLIQLKAYRGRSIEGYRTDVRRGFTIGNRKFRQVITGLALLGKNLPAVDGLADVADLYIAAAGNGDWQDGSVLYPVAMAKGDVVGDDPTDVGSRVVEESARALLKDLWNWKQDDPRGWISIDDVRDTYVVACFDGNKWSVPYTVNAAGEVAIGKPAEVRVVYVAASAPTAEERQAVLDQVLAALGELRDQIIPLISGKRDAPIVRTRFRALEQDVRRIAGAGIVANEKGGEPVDDKDKDKTTVANAAGDPPTPPAGTPGAAQAPAADGTMAFDNADQAMTYLAAMTGKNPTDLAGVVAACLAALKANEDAEGGEEDGTEEVGMAKDKDGAPNGEAPEAVAMAKQVTDLLKWKAEEEGRKVTERAEALVGAAIRQGKFVPAQRETLVALAKLDAGAFEAMAASQPVSVALGERGSAGGADGADQYEATPAELATMLKMNIPEPEARTMIRNNKRAEAGLPPEPLKEAK